MAGLEANLFLVEQPDNQLADLTEAARRAGSIVDEHINSIVDLAERRADEIRRSAERDAEATRREAVDSARRVFERINALERPLGELVQTLQSESQRVERELEGDVDAEVAEIPSAEGDPQTDGGALEVGDRGAAPEIQEGAVVEEQSPPALTGRERREQERAQREQERAQRREQRDREKAEREASAAREREAERTATPAEKPVAREPAAATAEEPAPQREPERQPSAVPATFEPVAEQPKRTFLSRLRRGDKKSGAFITTPGHCAVCQKTFTAGSEENLRLSGWKVSGDVGLCPEDQADGWQLPEGARLPFRRGGG